MIGWGARTCYMILQEGGFLPMSELNKLLLCEFQMSTHIAGIQREPVHDNIDRPRWCPAGLTRSQKRRIQRLRQIEALEEERKEAPKKKGVRSEVWRVKPRVDDKQDQESSAAPVNMVFVVPVSSWRQIMMMKSKIWRRLWLN